MAETTGTEITSYTYDGFNRTLEVQKPNGSYQLNHYDAMGLRVGMTENGVHHEFIFSGGNVIGEINSNTEAFTKYVRGYGLVAKEDPKGNTNYYLHNQHGDVINLVKGTGEILNGYQYDAFGNTTSYTEKVANRFRYAGEQFDNITGQYYLRARYYNPELGRFTQEDTYRGDGLNLYAYVSNNPIRYVDPSGNEKADKNTDSFRGRPDLPLSNSNGMVKVNYNGTFQQSDRTNKPTLEDLYELDEQKMKNQPIQINIHGNTIHVKAYINFTGDANEMFGNTGKTYSQLAVEGIEEKWTTAFEGSDYDFVKGLKGNIVTEVIYMVPGQMYFNNPNQKYMNINIDNKGKGVSNQNDSTKQSIIKDALTGDWSFYNWSITNPGRITLYKGYNGGEDYTESRYKGTAAHEFGHALGLGDAYFKDKNGVLLTPITPEVPANSIMRNNTNVTANDIEMVLEAFKTNQFQGYITHSSVNKKSDVIRLK